MMVGAPARRVRPAALGLPLLGALALSACVTGPDFKAPAEAAPPRFTAAALDNIGGELTAPASGDTAWWSALAVPQLDATIREALANNRGLEAQRQRLAAVEEQIGIANAALYPRVDLDASAGRVKYGAAFLGPDKLPPFSFYSIGPAVS